MIKVKFKNWMSVDRADIKTEPGSAYKDILAPIVKENGEIDLIVKGKTCIYDEIQSYKDSCDVNKLIERYRRGDTSALQARAVQFIDATQFPETYAEMLNTVIQAENFFSELPVDIKKQFDNNYYKFIASIGSDDFKAAFGLEPKAAAVVDQVVSDVKEEGAVNE